MPRVPGTDLIVYWSEIACAAACTVAAISFAGNGNFQAIAIPIIYCGLSILVGRLAPTLLRSQLAWLCLAIAFTPLVAGIFLFIGGTPHAAVLEKEEEDRRRAGLPGEDARQVAAEASRCPRCGAAVNFRTRDGLIGDPEAAWRLRCAACGAEASPP